jgi:hypothetical protein
MRSNDGDPGVRSLYTFALLAMLCAGAWWLYPTGVRTQTHGPRSDASLVAPGTNATSETQGLPLRAALNPLAQLPTREEQDRQIVEDAARALDQRLFDEPQDEAEVARLESAFDAIIERLPEDVKTEVACASTLCRLVIRGSGDAVGKATHAVAQGMPKLFTGTVVLPTARGESTIYLARDPALLDYSATATTSL